MPDLSDYSGQMLGNANRAEERRREELAMEDEVSVMSIGARKQYRGLPLFPARGSIIGTMDGTDPLQALLDKEERGELRW